MKTTSANDFKQRWAEEAARHGHRPNYYNDSDCGGCAQLRAHDATFAMAAHMFANERTERKATVLP